MTKQDLMEKAREIISIEYSQEPLKKAAQDWIDAIDGPKESETAKHLMEELDENVCSIDTYLSFLEKYGVEYYGEEGSKEKKAEALVAKDQGEKYCLCDACQAGGAILDEKDLVLD